MSLDKRLKDVLNDADNLNNPMSPDWDINVEKMSEAIKQAFIDEGWLQVKYTPGSRYEFPMTGPEWLARFEKDLKGEVFPHHCSDDVANIANTLERCRLAARRAAGVDE